MIHLKSTMTPLEFQVFQIRDAIDEASNELNWAAGALDASMRNGTGAAEAFETARKHLHFAAVSVSDAIAQLTAEETI